MDFSTMYFDSWLIADNTAILHIVWILVAAVLGIIAVAVNAIRGIPIYKTARIKDLPLSILSFFPFTQGFVMGMIADENKKTLKGKASFQRFILPVTSLVKWIAYIVFSIKLLECIDQFGTLCDEYPDWIPFEKGIDMIVSFIPSVCILLGVFAVLSLIHHVFFNISLYRIFAEQKPVTAVVMTALSVMFGGIMALVMLFASRSHEDESVLS